MKRLEELKNGLYNIYDQYIEEFGTVMLQKYIEESMEEYFDGMDGNLTFEENEDK
jgi:hypothetical protein